MWIHSKYKFDLRKEHDEPDVAGWEDFGQMADSIIDGIKEAQVNRRYGAPDMRPRQIVQYNVIVEEVQVEDQHVNLAIHLTIPSVIA